MLCKHFSTLLAYCSGPQTFFVMTPTPLPIKEPVCTTTHLEPWQEPQLGVGLEPWSGPGAGNGAMVGSWGQE